MKLRKCKDTYLAQLQLKRREGYGGLRVTGREEEDHGIQRNG